MRREIRLTLPPILLDARELRVLVFEQLADRCSLEAPRLWWLLIDVRFRVAGLDEGELSAEDRAQRYAANDSFVHSVQLARQTHILAVVGVSGEKRVIVS